MTAAAVSQMIISIAMLITALGGLIIGLRTQNQVKEVNSALWDKWKKPRAQLSIAELEAQLSYLKQWLADGYRP